MLKLLLGVQQFLIIFQELLILFLLVLNARPLRSNLLLQFEYQLLGLQLELERQMWQLFDCVEKVRRRRGFLARRS